MSAQAPIQLADLDPEQARAIETQVASALVDTPISNSEFAGLILAEASIAAVGLGLVSFTLAWDAPTKALQGKVPPDAQSTIAATTHAIVTPFCLAILDRVAKRYPGRLQEQHKTRLQQAATIAADIVCGTVAVGTGFGSVRLSTGAVQIAGDLGIDTAAFVASFFAYRVLTCLADAALLKSSCRKVQSQTGAPASKALEEAIASIYKELFSLRAIVTEFVPRFCGTALFPVLANVIGQYFDSKGLSPFIGMMLNVFWFFTEYNAFMLAGQAFAEKMLPASNQTQTTAHAGNHAE
ncbi:MAG TPA: hypothetical protein VFS01_04130 [Rhizomicrobium sp.]|nr:hypothetical protein [Rhizomicrobium sp.]